MANNLFVSYDLYRPGQDYETVSEAIKSLGNWAKVQQSLWYVNSTYTASDAAKKVRSVMDKNDSLIVIDCTNNKGYWYNVGDEVSQYIQNHWFTQSYQYARSF